LRTAGATPRQSGGLCTTRVNANLNALALWGAVDGRQRSAEVSPIEMGFDFAQRHALLKVHPCCTDQFRRMQND
jgi:hypothetical protein